MENLTIPSMAVIDPRSFSIKQFARAVGINWCMRTRNNLLRAQPRVIRNHEYNEEKFQQLVTLAQTNGILDDVSGSRGQAKLIADRFGEELLNLSNND